MTSLAQFNGGSAAVAAQLLRPCLDVDRWADVVVAGRPYADIEALLAAAGSAADPFTVAEIDAALAHHPRIGERPQGPSAEAELARSEQSGLHLGGDTEQRLVTGNAAYEKRFGRVFLIRAAGRSSQEILDQLNSRLANDPEQENAVIGDQLRQIAALRLAAVVTS